MPGEVNINEVLIEPVESMIRQVAKGVAEAQIALDQASIDAQVSLKKLHPELEALNYHVNWYHMPEVTVELKVAVHYESSGRDKKPGLFITPFNAKYKNTFAYQADGASLLKFRIVPIPPPLKSE